MPSCGDQRAKVECSYLKKAGGPVIESIPGGRGGAGRVEVGWGWEGELGSGRQCLR